MNRSKIRNHPSDKDGGLVISSLSALKEYLRFAPSHLTHVSCAEKDRDRLTNLLIQNGCQPSLIKIDAELSEGFVAGVRIQSEDEALLIDQVRVRSKDLIVACDHITDTRNLGAIARSAAFFGVKNLILPKDRQAPITSATLGAAQGAFACLTPVYVTNLARTLESLKEAGYWVMAADMEGIPAAELKQSYEKIVLVLGAEDKGISPNILKKSDIVLSIPSRAEKLESLNVSVAAGILIHALDVNQQRHIRNPVG